MATSALGSASITSASPPVLENGKPSDATNRILTMRRPRIHEPWDEAYAIQRSESRQGPQSTDCINSARRGTSIPDPNVARKFSNIGDPRAETSLLSRGSIGMNAPVPLTGLSKTTRLIGRPSDWLGVLFVVSTTLWLLVFLAVYASHRLGALLSSHFGAGWFCPAGQLVTLFPNGSTTPRPTLPR